MKKKLLLADDSITIQKVVGIIFATEDYELLTASDGDKAFELALVHKPDLVIADIFMPGKNGFDLCREIKSHPDLGVTSVLLLPGAFEEFDEARAVEVCADGWLIKPFESQALIDKVTALVEMPPLRLAVTAATSDVADETPETIDFAGQSADSDTDTSFATEQEVSFAPQEPIIDLVEEEIETTDASEDADGELWGEVSFEEEDLKPQELLAASDQDEEDAADASADESDLYEPDQGLTPEQLSPYASAPESAAPSKDLDAPEFDEAKEEFELVSDQPVGEEVVEIDHLVAGPTANGDDELELMEETLDQEEELIEDSTTFIDLTEAEEATAEPVSTDGEVFTFEADENPDDDEILDLTEGDVLEEEAVVAAPADSFAAEAPTQAHDNLFVAPQDQTADKEDAAEGSYRRRDDNLFTDVDESLAATEDDIESMTSTTADYEAEFEASDLVEVEPEEMAAEVDPSESPTFEPALAGADPQPSSEMVEEQLRQLPEEEVARIVEKVAGPLIERLAREMLEQTVWEVVPDLAETMIRAEIEKIKRGES
ncbi:response regulator [Pelovirga terrestris]|uniref:Response regulator n=1 Tax=Pelovirga terrestris TaxID=2771352 RepID=A0A8J6UNE5_9BACT|nr:response regulator [Pelovirga terrestris]MBD1399389.1 response regulator [Pelovirga terrestris]